MTTATTAAKAAARLASDLGEAIAAAKAAYGFVPNCYTCGCLSKCLAAEQALAVLAASLSILEAEHD